AFGNGTIFRMTPAGDVTTLYSFTADPQVSSFIAASDGNLYGTTLGSFTGGTLDRGAIFRVTPGGQVTVLHTGGFNGAAPGDLMEATDGNFYGTSGDRISLDPLAQAGAVFKMSSSGIVSL